MKHRYVPVVTVVVLCLMGSSCRNGVPAAGDVWEKVLSSCGATDLNKSKPLYFGAANVNGVGSIWSYDAATGDYWPASQFKDITAVGGVVYDNTPLACKGEVTSGIEFKLGASAKPVVYPVSAEVQSTLNNAETAKVSVTSIVLQEAYWDKFNTEFRKLPQNSPIMEGMQLNNRFVVGRAWKVKGFSAVLTFKGDAAASAEAALKAQAGAGTLGVSFKRTSNSTLEISSNEDLFVAGVLRKLSPGGLSAGSGNPVGPEVETASTAKVKPLR